MKRKDTLTIIDIGSHKLEELSILVYPNNNRYLRYMAWATMRIIKSIIKMDFVKLFQQIPRQLKVIRYYFVENRKYNLNIIAIEPNIDVANKYAKMLAKKYPVYYLPIVILGHDANKEIELKKLFFYDKTISSSIYHKNIAKPINKKKTTLSLGIKFGTLWDELVKENIINENDPFILRMNCEGSEMGIIQECREKKLIPLCIIGSLGDIKKVHGDKLDSEARKILDEMNVPFFYFKGDDPGTWYGMMDIWKHYTAKHTRR